LNEDSHEKSSSISQNKGFIRMIYGKMRP